MDFITFYSSLFIIFYPRNGFINFFVDKFRVKSFFHLYVIIFEFEHFSASFQSTVRVYVGGGGGG